MTGRFAIRSGTHSIPIGGGQDGLTQWEVTIAKLLSEVGYTTGHFGKWHLGSEQGRLPNDQGFDEWYGIPRTTDEAFWPSEPAAMAAGVPFMHIMEGHKGEESRELAVYDLEQRRLIDTEITRRTINFMKRSVESGKRFYAYVPFTQVHFPTLPHPKFAGTTGFGDFRDALAEMDAHVDEILDAIDELHIRENTIVVFTSDNGPEATWPWQGSSGPWRGYYFTHMEGSLRVPFIVRWPDHVPAGRVSNEIVHEVDTYVTFAKIAGAQLPQDRPIDGVDQTDFLLGKSEKSSRDGFPVFVVGIADNTIVLYTTDNGPHGNSWPDAAITPFRSEKATNWEGAFRVPCMIRWPGTKDAGPLVIDVPPAEGGVFAGNIDTVWQMPLEDVGPFGADQGKGGKYLILPPDYKGQAPQGYFVLQPDTYTGYALIRSNLKSHCDAYITAAVNYGKRLKVYLLSQSANPSETSTISLAKIQPLKPSPNWAEALPPGPEPLSVSRSLYPDSINPCASSVTVAPLRFA